MSDVDGTVTRGDGDKPKATLVLRGRLCNKDVDWPELIEVLKPLLKRYGIEVKEVKGSGSAPSRPRRPPKKR